MAPSRRKGASKAAAAAAARRQWKVGDLVLAKVKGFPAWPATVSEPEKWGYSTDWKKVLVYFFGTQQIAFCNPADVEAFTEEKKQSLVKRQGKGGDFVRAVKEIVDSYEKLKKERQLGEADSDAIVAGDNVSNPQNLSAKNQTDAPDLSHTLPMKSSESVIDRHELLCAAEDDSAAVLKDKSDNKGTSLEELADSAAAVQSPKPVTYCSRKRSTGELYPQGYVSHRHMPVRRSRSSSRAQNFLLPCNDVGKSAGSPSTNASRSASVRRNGRVRNSPDLSDCNDFDSSALDDEAALTMEDNSSEILTMDSDAFSLNEGSTIDSKFKRLETIECPGEVLLNKGLDLEIKGVVNKKKRKPNRRRATHDASKLTCRLEEELVVQSASQSSQNISGNSQERGFEQDGDAHLPLVKRARVRMGKSSCTEAELDSLAQGQGENCKEDVNSPQQLITSSNCENGSSADEDSSVLNGAMDNISPSKILAPCSETQIFNTKKDQTFCSLDDEAALPPTKRLHRALEAMSANAAEEGQTHIEASSSRMTSSGVSCISSVKGCPCISINNHEGDGSGLRKFDACDGDSSHTVVHCLSNSSNPVILTENKSSKQEDRQLTRFQLQETGNDVLPCTADRVGQELSDYVVCPIAKADLKIQEHGQISLNRDSKFYVLGSNKDSPDSSLSPNGEGEGNVTALNHSNAASDTSERNGINLHPVVDVKNDIILPQHNIDVPQNEVAVCEDTQCLKPAVDDVNRENDTREIVEEIKCKGPDEDSNSVSASGDHMGEKGILGIQSSPSLTDGGDRVPQESPPNSPVCNVSTSDSSNVLHNGSCSPDVHLHQKQSLPGPVDESKDGSVATQQSRSMGKSTEAGRAALLYFEAMLGTLTRTKESIGRATRIAIDCAKFGIANKVMEILADNLESESSLRRRVDLFFLVDSIAQSSRGLKGDVCGVYPSAIQAVLSRLLSAAVPPGSASQENRRQCLKVLRLWLERKILPESFIRHHIRELDVYSSASTGVVSQRCLRTERALDDPIREMEGMLVDEYGSNSSLQLPGFCMPRMLKDEDDNEGSDSDGGNFEAVTPEHNSELHEMTSTIDKRRHILEDVDGELEMEDVAPSCDVEMSSFCNVDRGNAREFENNIPVSFAPSLQDVPPSCPPPPPSPPPPPPPPPLPPPMLHRVSSTSDPCRTVARSKAYTESQRVKDNSHHSVAQPMAAPRDNQPINDAVRYQVPEYREMQLHMRESSCSFNSFRVPPPDNYRHSDGVSVHNKGYSIRPPRHVLSNQFSFVHGEQQMKHRREVPPPPPYSNGQHFMQNMERDNFNNNHERSKPPPYDYRERWDVPAPYSGPRFQDKGMPGPHGCHPCESTRIPGHGWRFPPRSMNHRNSMPFRPPFEDAIPVANRGPSFWGPR